MDTTPVIATSREHLASLPRQELTFTACDALASRSRKPSVALVRETTIEIAGVKKGSDGDVQEDIRLWYDGLFALKRDVHIDGVPDRIMSMFHTLWRAAKEQADERLVVDREKLAAERHQWKTEVERATLRSEALQHELAIARQEISSRDNTIERLDEVVASQAAEQQALQSLLRAKDERIEGLTAELGRKSAELAAGLVELNGARQHALLQIDQARAEGRHWKEQYERADQEARGARTAADTYRSKANNLEAGLANVEGRLTVIQDNLSRTQARTETLERQLVEAHEAGRRLQIQAAEATHAAEITALRAETALRELGEARQMLIASQSRERDALEAVAAAAISVGPPGHAS